MRVPWVLSRATKAEMVETLVNHANRGPSLVLLLVRASVKNVQADIFSHRTVLYTGFHVGSVPLAITPPRAQPNANDAGLAHTAT